MFEKRQRTYSGFYRGIVLDNVDPKVKGRCKIFIPGLYPAKYNSDASSLPWAEPAMPIFGGSFTNSEDGQESETGMTSPPHIGANLWVFFESGDHNNPVYCFAIQGGDGWHSEHPNQHVIKTDNVRIRIDEDVDHPDSTTKFPSYNSNCTYLSTPNKIDAIPTRLDIEVTGPTNIILNSNLDKDSTEPALNLQINGNVFTEINGDVHETVVGNIFRKHDGNLHVVHNGTSVIEQTGNKTEKIDGHLKTTVTQNVDLFVDKNYTRIVTKSENVTVGVSQTHNITQRQLIVNGTNNVLVQGIQNITTTGFNNETYVAGVAVSTAGFMSLTSASGTSITSTPGDVIVEGTIIRLN